jgi:hypothetical protein
MIRTALGLLSHPEDLEHATDISVHPLRPWTLEDRWRQEIDVSQPSDSAELYGMVADRKATRVDAGFSRARLCCSVRMGAFDHAVSS